MARKTHVQFSFLWGVALIVGCGILGVYCGQAFGRIWTNYLQTSYRRPTITGIDKNKIADRFVSVYPVFRVANKK